MAQYNYLFDSTDGYVFYVLPTGIDTFLKLQTQLSAAYPNAVVRRINGSACRTSIDFFNAVAVALEFPDDRVSWNILNERLFDLTWLPARAYLLMVDNADQFLADGNDGGLEILNDIFGSLSRYRSSSAAEPIPRKVLLHSPPAALPDLLQRLQGDGIRFFLLQRESEQMSTHALGSVDEATEQEIADCGGSID